jgi:hypothetical protein
MLAREADLLNPDLTNGLGQLLPGKGGYRDASIETGSGGPYGNANVR